MTRQRRPVRLGLRENLAQFSLLVVVADAFGVTTAVWLVAALTMASGAVVAIRMRETLAPKIATEAA